MKYDVKAIQSRLNKLGFAPGPIDGVMGRRTIGAIKRYQIQHNLLVDGVVGPKTFARMFNFSHEEAESNTEIRLLAIPWLELALTKKGLHEDINNEELKRFLRSDGETLGDPSKLPWCGDFVETCLALTLPNETLPSNPYLARNWSEFGQHVEPTLGAVGSFWRASRTALTGHVAFLVGKGEKVFYILGGNQSDRVSITAISAARLIDSRWPRTVTAPRKIFLPTMQGGQLSINEA